MNNSHGQRLKELRIERNVSQKQLAEYLGYEQSGISHYEKGNRQMDATTLIKIAEFFNTSVDYLLGRENKEMIKRTEQRPAIAKQEQEYLDALNALNAIGKIKALAYIQGLQTSKEFTD